MHKRLIFMICLCLTLAAGLLSCHADSATWQSATSQAKLFTPIHVTLTWTKDNTTSQTITWTTASSVQTGLVQYAAQEPGFADIAERLGVKADELRFKGSAGFAKASWQTLKTGTKKQHIFSTTLTGLRPGTRYFYRIKDGRNWSRTYTFSTAQEEPQNFNFLVFGDSQSSGDYLLWKQDIHSAYSANPDARFFVNVGDLVDHGHDYTEWDSWFTGCNGIIDTLTAMPVRGNHDSDETLWKAQFKLPQNGPRSGKGLTYSFNYGNAHFVMLDNLEQRDSAALQEQKHWLANDLKNTSKPWKLVFFHKPLYVCKTGRNNEYLKLVYLEILEKYHTDIVFNGHDHAVARTYPILEDKAVDPPQGVIHYITGRSGSKFYTDSWPKSQDVYFYNPVDQPTYTDVNVAGQTMSIKTLKLDGTVLDTLKIEK